MNCGQSSPCIWQMKKRSAAVSLFLYDRPAFHLQASKAARAMSRYFL